MGVRDGDVRTAVGVATGRFVAMGVREGAGVCAAAGNETISRAMNETKLRRSEFTRGIITPDVGTGICNQLLRFVSQGQPLVGDNLAHSTHYDVYD